MQIEVKGKISRRGFEVKFWMAIMFYWKIRSINN